MIESLNIGFIRLRNISGTRVAVLSYEAKDQSNYYEPRTVQKGGYVSGGMDGPLLASLSATDLASKRVFRHWTNTRYLL